MAVAWITLERCCFPFVTFELRWAQGASVPMIDITGLEVHERFSMPKARISA